MSVVCDCEWRAEDASVRRAGVLRKGKKQCKWEGMEIEWPKKAHLLESAEIWGKADLWTVQQLRGLAFPCLS